MNYTELEPFTAFAGERHIASGDLREVVRRTKNIMDAGSHDAIFIFENACSQQVEIDFRGTLEDVLARLPQTRDEPLEAAASAGPGRPRLGVVAREVTLLPRHWEWLATQRGGASVTLRRLVEEARRASLVPDQARAALESLDRFMRVMAGDFAGYEEATRWLYRKDWERFDSIIEKWPNDVREHIQKLGNLIEWALPVEIR